jgi:hypothetical protein
MNYLRFNACNSRQPARLTNDFLGLEQDEAMGIIVYAVALSVYSYVNGLPSLLSLRIWIATRFIALEVRRLTSK